MLCSPPPIVSTFPSAPGREGARQDFVLRFAVLGGLFVFPDKGGIGASLEVAQVLSLGRELDPTRHS